MFTENHLNLQFFQHQIPSLFYSNTENYNWGLRYLCAKAQSFKMVQKIWKTINMPTCPSGPLPSCQDLWKETKVVRKSHFLKQGMIHVLLFLVLCKGGADCFWLLGLYSGSTLKSGFSWCDTVYRAVDQILSVWPFKWKLLSSAFMGKMLMFSTL